MFNLSAVDWAGILSAFAAMAIASLLGAPVWISGLLAICAAIAVGFIAAAINDLRES